MTTFGTQSITTLNNLNMEGEFASSSITQFEHVNTATIIYANSLGSDSVESTKTIILYDAIAGSNVTFAYKPENGLSTIAGTITGGTGYRNNTAGDQEFEQKTNADTTAGYLKDAINNHPNFSADITTGTNTITVTQTTSKSIRY